MSALSAERWSDLWSRLGATAPTDAAFDDLVARHREPQRSYHTAEHVLAVLAALDSAREFAEDFDSCELALWFHDVVYDVRAESGLNEAQSAEHCVNEFERLVGPINDQAAFAMTHILATAHTAGDEPPDLPDTRLVLDCDLSILGAAPDAFDRYDEQIRREYAWVPEPDYRAGRAKVLQHFLDQPAIFLTPAFAGREAQARSNLQRAISRLDAAS